MEVWECSRKVRCGCPKGRLFSGKEIEGIIFWAIMQTLAMCQEWKKQEKFCAHEDYNGGTLTKNACRKQWAETGGRLAVKAGQDAREHLLSEP